MGVLQKYILLTLSSFSKSLDNLFAVLCHSDIWVMVSPELTNNGGGLVGKSTSDDDVRRTWRPGSHTLSLCYAIGCSLVLHSISQFSEKAYKQCTQWRPAGLFIPDTDPNTDTNTETNTDTNMETNRETNTETTMNTNTDTN